MSSLDYWINKNKKSVAFYTDDKGRKRPIIKKHRGEGDSHYIMSDQELLDYVKSLLYEYCKDAGVGARPVVKVNNRWRRKIAHVKFNIFGDEVEEPVVSVNLMMFKKFYEVNPVYADKILRFSIAHEVAHLRQREEYGYNIIAEPDTILEWEADKTAAELSGIPEDEAEKMELEIRKKILENKPRKKPSRRESILKMDGKIVARVLGWENIREKNKLTLPPLYKKIRSIDDVPRKARHVWIITFDEDGNPHKKGRWITREELERNYVITP